IEPPWAVRIPQLRPECAGPGNPAYPVRKQKADCVRIVLDGPLHEIVPELASEQPGAFVDFLPLPAWRVGADPASVSIAGQSIDQLAMRLRVVNGRPTAMGLAMFALVVRRAFHIGQAAARAF